MTTASCVSYTRGVFAVGQEVDWRQLLPEDRAAVVHEVLGHPYFLQSRFGPPDITVVACGWLALRITTGWGFLELAARRDQPAPSRVASIAPLSIQRSFDYHFADLAPSVIQVEVIDDGWESVLATRLAMEVYRFVPQIETQLHRDAVMCMESMDKRALDLWHSNDPGQSAIALDEAAQAGLSKDVEMRMRFFLKRPRFVIRRSRA